MSEEVLDNVEDTSVSDTADESTVAEAEVIVADDKPADKATDKAVEKPTDKQEAYWKDDWRQRLAKGDEKYLKQLGRFASPEALADAFRAAQAKISSGELKAPLSKDSTPEEIAAWREENGIPETPDKYVIEGFDASKLPEEDKDKYKGFLEVAHGVNLKPDQIKPLVEWNAQQEEARKAAQYDKDQQDKANVMDKLNVEWGAGYRANVNAISGLLTTFPESVREAVKGARMPDGTLMFNNPDVMRGFVAVALKDNPAATVVPSSGGDPMKNIEGRIKEIETMMSKDRKAYDKDEKVQAEYRELITAQQKLLKRAA